MKAKRQTEVVLNLATILDGNWGHVRWIPPATARRTGASLNSFVNLLFDNYDSIFFQ